MTDTNKMRDISREQFEYHFLVELAHEECDFHMDGDRYVCQATEDRWYAWQASREAVVVELPRDIDQFADDDPGRRAFSLHTNTAYRDCRRIIEAQGLKVTP